MELEPKAGSEHFGECEGVFVLVYLSARNLRSALDAAEAWAKSSHYDLLDIDHCIRVNLAEYEPHDEDHPSADELRHHLKPGEVLTGPFYCYLVRH